MNFIYRSVLLFLLLLISNYGFSQLIRNPSFEGYAGVNYPPVPWTPCNNFSTPDTQPGAWNVKTPPSHGNTYLGLVTRGNLGPYANINEAAQIQLNSDLISNQKYEYSIDLAFSNTEGHEVDWSFLSYANPAILKIWGGTSSCEKTELLWESPVINHLDWKTYQFTITPKNQKLKYLILDAIHTSSPTYFGNILIDNIVEKTIIDPNKILCPIEAYNIFTPNGDGINDLFQFKYASNISDFSLNIYNRWGNLIFQSKEINQSWDGTNKGNKCTAGVYYWQIEYRCSENAPELIKKMKGFVELVR